MKLLPLSLVLLLLAVVLHGAKSTSDNDNDHNNNVGVDMLDEGDILDEGFFDQEYFHDMSENDRRKLQDFPAYKTPKWWGRYKKMVGSKYIRKCDKWIIDHMEPPRSGSLYCPKFSGNYTCFFGEQKCDENGRKPQNHPDQQCTCVDKEWRCKDWSCLDPFFYTCPRTYDQLEKSNNKCLGNMKCSFKDSDAKCNCVDGEFVCTGGTSVDTKPAQVVCPPTKEALFKQNEKTGKCPDNLSCMYDDGQVTSSCGCLNDQIVCSDLQVFLPPVKPAVMDTCPDEEKTFIANKDICKDGLKCRFKNSSYHATCTCSGGEIMCSAVSANPPVLYAQPPLTTTIDDPPPATTTVLDTCPATEKEFLAGKDNCKDGLKCRFTTKSYVATCTCDAGDIVCSAVSANPPSIPASSSTNP